MRKYSWILALLAALAMIFVGCGDSGGGGGGEEEETGYEYPVETKFIQITQRSANWHTIDIKAGFSFSKGELNVTDFYTEDKDHVITVFGRALGAANIKFAGAQNVQDAPGGGGQGNLEGGTFTPGENGEFTLTRTFTWAEISRNNDIRINGFDANIPYINFYEITIVDANDLEVYALSKDPDVQGKEHGAVVLQESPPIGTTWLVGALGGSTPNAIGKVFDPSTASGPCCDDCEDGCFDCDNDLCVDDCTVTCCIPPFTLAALEALSGGLTLTAVGDALPEFDATTKVAKFVIVPIDPLPETGNTALSSGVQFTWADAGISNWAAIGLKQSVKITYAAFIESGNAEVTVKKDAGGSWGSAGDLVYTSLAGGPATTLTGTKAAIGADSTGLTITANVYGKPNPAAVYYVKILKVEIAACPDCGEDVCICLPCNCYCAACLTAKECTVANCGTGCECYCHYWAEAGVTDPIIVTLSVDTTTPGTSFAAGAAVMAMDDDALKITYTAENQIGWIKLTSEQAAIIENTRKYGGTIKIDIQGTATDGFYRACLGKVDAGSAWDGTGMIGGNNIAFAAGINGEKDLTWGGSGAGSGGRFEFIIIQTRPTFAAGDVIITSVTITPVAYTAP